MWRHISMFWKSNLLLKKNNLKNSYKARPENWMWISIRMCPGNILVDFLFRANLHMRKNAVLSLDIGCLQVVSAAHRLCIAMCVWDEHSKCSCYCLEKQNKPYAISDDVTSSFVTSQGQVAYNPPPKHVNEIYFSPYHPNRRMDLRSLWHEG